MEGGGKNRDYRKRERAKGEVENIDGKRKEEAKWITPIKWGIREERRRRWIDRTRRNREIGGRKDKLE